MWADVGHQNGWAVRYQSSVMLGGFQSQLEASSIALQRNSLSVDDNIYIYIYIYLEVPMV